MVILLYGLSAAGKTTLAQSLSKSLRPSVIFDGDELRDGLNSDLGFSRKHCIEALRRAVHTARLVSKAGYTAIVAMIAPSASSRVMAREICSDVEFYDIFLNCPLETCKERDPKGLYEKASKGLIFQMAGLDEPFEISNEAPDFTIDTSELSVKEARDLVLDFLFIGDIVKED